MARVPEILPPEDLPPGSPSWLRAWLLRVRLVMQLRDPQNITAGDPLDKFVDRRELVEVGLYAPRPGGGFLPGVTGGEPTQPGPAGPPGPPGEPYTPDLTPPPTPTGLTVQGALFNLLIGWDAPTYTQGRGHARTLIYGAVWAEGTPAPTFNDPRTKLIDTAGGPVTIHAYPTSAATRYAIWIKWQTVDGVESTNPAGGANGVVASTGQDPSALLAILTGQITESQLFATLGARINLIDGPATLANSVAARVKTETDARVAAILAEEGARIAGDASTLTTATSQAQTYTQTWSYNKSEVDGAIAGLGSSITTSFQAADAATLTSANTYTATYAYSRSDVDGALNALSTTLSAAITTGDGNTLTSANAFTTNYTFSQAQIDGALAALETELRAEIEELTAGGVTLAQVQAYVGSYTYAQATIDGAFSNQFNVLTANYTAADQGILSSAQNYTNSYAYTLANGNALAGNVSQLSVRVGSAEAAIQQESTVRAGQTGALFAQWTVKLDVNGYVSGFGLASTAGNAAPTSSFIVRADRFEVAAPSGPGIAPLVPFIVRTTSSTEGNAFLPPGVYISAANIVDLTVLYARISTLVADSITTASLSAAQLTAGSGVIGGNLRSANYVPGLFGWQLQPNGAAEFSNIVIRNGLYSGQLSAATGTFSGALSAATGTFAGSLSAATGTFSGTLATGTATRSGTTMTGSGGRWEPDGTGCWGTAAVNITHDGAQLRINGPLVTDGNLALSTFAVTTDIASVFISITNGDPATVLGPTATASGGTAPYVYEWTMADVYSEPIGAGNAWIGGTSNGGRYAAPVVQMIASNGSVSASMRCTVRDANGRIASASVGVSAQRGNPQ
jgi:hypothetical protein